MAYTTIDKSSLHFNTKLYTGNGSAGHGITGVGFQPDFTWIKDRGNSINHSLFDAVRGIKKEINSNANTAEETEHDMLTAFGTDGFTLGTAGGVNGNSNNYASWNWKANGAGSSNTDGSINTTYTSVNTTAGFSISSYTGTGANATFGHGLGAKPEWVIIKNLSSTTDWRGYFDREGNSKSTALNTSGASGSGSDYWNSTSPTSSVVSIGTNTGLNASGSNYIAYCFTPKTGYSKMGKYKGNGSLDGTFVYCGFKPSLVIIKDADNAGENWFIFDNKRPGRNFNANLLNPNSSTTETTSGANGIDILSNGFKCREDNNGTNRSGAGFNYLAIGQSIVGSNNIPAVAR